MRELRQTLQPFKGRGACIRIEYKNRMFITGLKSSEAIGLKSNKPLLVLILSESRSFTIGTIVESLNQMIDYSDRLLADGGYELHTADIKALSIGRVYLDTYAS